MSKKNSVLIGSHPRKLLTVFGEVHFDLPRLKCKDCQTTRCLTTGRLGDLAPLGEANTTASMRKLAILCGSSWPFRQAASVLGELTHVRISFSQIQKLCADEAEQANALCQQSYQREYDKALAQTMEVPVEFLDEEIPDSHFAAPEAVPVDNGPQSGINRFYIGIDGTFVNGLSAGRSFEAKVGIIFTGERIQVSKDRNLLLNKMYVGSCENVDAFSEKLFLSTRQMGIDHESELIILADGARWITKLAKTQYTNATLILDWWHLKERVWKTVDWLKDHGLTPTLARSWGQSQIDRLWQGQVTCALQSCVTLGKQLSLEPPTGKSQRELGEESLQSFYLYLTNNFDSIVDYQSYRRAGYFISSVFVEKTIDLLICRRLKLRGQNWSRDGADNIATFRQMILNDDFDDYWKQPKAA